MYDPDAVTEIIAVLNMALGFAAAVGYFLRIAMNVRYQSFSRGKILLLLYFWSAFSIFILYLFISTGWIKYLAPDYETFVLLYVRPFFTFLVMVFLLSTWTHPDMKSINEALRQTAWRIFNHLTGKK